jgi:hypothetical protein
MIILIALGGVLHSLLVGIFQNVAGYDKHNNLSDCSVSVAIEFGQKILLQPVVLSEKAAKFCADCRIQSLTCNRIV